MRALILSGLLIVALGCRRAAPPPSDTASSDAVKVLKTPDNPYFIIYHPAVDLAKQPTPQPGR